MSPIEAMSDTPFAAQAVLRQRLPGFAPQVAMVLGSGLGALADLIADPVTIAYAGLPGFPVSTVDGHAGVLVAGTLGGVAVLCMKGRSHFYEGKGADVMTSAIRTFRLAGCESLLLTVPPALCAPTPVRALWSRSPTISICCPAIRWWAAMMRASVRAS